MSKTTDKVIEQTNKRMGRPPLPTEVKAGSRMTVIMSPSQVQFYKDWDKPVKGKVAAGIRKCADKGGIKP